MKSTKKPFYVWIGVGLIIGSILYIIFQAIQGRQSNNVSESSTPAISKPVVSKSAVSKQAVSNPAGKTSFNNKKKK